MTVFKRKGGDIWRSKSSDVEFEGGSAAIRNKSHFAALTFELKLKTARGGGGGYGQISESIKKRMNINIPTILIYFSSYIITNTINTITINGIFVIA